MIDYYPCDRCGDDTENVLSLIKRATSTRESSLVRFFTLCEECEKLAGALLDSFLVIPKRREQRAGLDDSGHNNPAG